MLTSHKTSHLSSWEMKLRCVAFMLVGFLWHKNAGSCFQTLSRTISGCRPGPNNLLWNQLLKHFPFFYSSGKQSTMIRQSCGVGAVIQICCAYIYFLTSDFLDPFRRMLVSLQPTSDSTHIDFGAADSILQSSTLEKGVCDTEASQGSRCSH